MSLKSRKTHGNLVSERPSNSASGFRSRQRQSRHGRRSPQAQIVAIVVAASLSCCIVVLDCLIGTLAAMCGVPYAGGVLLIALALPVLVSRRPAVTAGRQSWKGLCSAIATGVIMGGVNSIGIDAGGAPLRWESVVDLCLLSPIGEELVYREWMWKAWREFRSWTKTLITSAAFMTSHIALVVIIGSYGRAWAAVAVTTFVAGIVLGVIRARLGLLCAILCHGGANVVWTMLVFGD